MRSLIAIIILFYSALSARAELTIEIQQGVDNPISIAVVPFGWQGPPPLAEDLAAIVSADLRRSGQFAPVKQSNMLAFPHKEADVYFRDWKVLGADYLLIGDVQPTSTGYRVSFSLFDVPGQRRLLTQTVNGTARQLRELAHFASDKVYENLTGIRGAFSTQLVYVEATRNQGKEKFRLMLADADGARPRLLLESVEPILSPEWSPDGAHVAYVSFETGRPAIFRQEIATAKREQLTNFKGLNGAPSWSPDGRTLAMTLSRDGNPEIYTMDLASKRLTRVTRHFAIDTEPNWTSDGKGVIFTSNRGGKPQIYQVTLASGRVERLTFEGDYNARGRVSRDGKTLVMVHRQSADQGMFHIAAQDLATGDVRILTETSLDESPSIAPNGALLMYATKYRGKGILAAVSLDAGTRFRLPSQHGNVREPAWSPFFN